MQNTRSFYWHDYETWGVQPSVDRACQFAGLRTDLDFNPIGKPLVIYAQPADDFLPHPGACMVTGITPQTALNEGAPEADFFRFIHDEMIQPGTCSLGYNTLRFDDEVTRYGLYRNFYDPYAREYKNGNSRWDLIDVVRLTRALRPEGINWPTKEDGVTSFRLEELTAANDIPHQGAHDALVDVQATIAIAKLVKQAQPKLFDYVFNHRDKHTLSAMLSVRECKPVLHVSAKYPARLGCIAAVVPVAMHPTNRNAVIVYDLRVDPTPLLTLSPEQIRERIYTPAAQLPEGVERIPLKAIHVNKAPVVVPMSTLTDKAREEWQLDAHKEQRHLSAIQQAIGLNDKVAEVFKSNEFPPQTDPDKDLYGSFLSDSDRQNCQQIVSSSVDELVDLHLHFDAPKLSELLFRYRARNWPEKLTKDERARWHEYRMQRLIDPDAGAGIVLKDYQKELSRLAIDSQLSEEKRAVVNALLDWPQQIGLE